MEVHLVPSRVSTEKRTFIYQFRDEPQSIESTILIVDDFTASRFSKLDNARHYSKLELESMVQWFDNQQRVWGVEQVLLWVAEEFIFEVTDFLGDNIAA